MVGHGKSTHAPQSARSLGNASIALSVIGIVIGVICIIIAIILYVTGVAIASSHLEEISDQVSHSLS